MMLIYVILAATALQVDAGSTQLLSNPCHSDPCKFGATCVNRQYSYECICAEGYIGTNCDQKPKPGRCPVPEQIFCFVPVHECINDESCPGDELCCSNNCGNVCRDPVPDCSTVLCPEVLCEHGYVPYTPTGECCSRCERCAVDDCPKIRCAPGYVSYIPDGECCPACKRDCRLVRCGSPDCDESLWYTPQNECCPVCRDCSLVSCLKPVCGEGFELYTQQGECCPGCRKATCPYESAGPCSTVLGPECPPGSTCVPDGSSPGAAGLCCLDRPNVDKPGTCPPLPPGTIGICVELCAGDYSCPGTEKCCSNGCGHVCTVPLPDCSAVSCLKQVCGIGFELHTPQGECCPRCRRVSCPHGSIGTCGTIAGLQCPSGSSCVLDGPYPDAAGVCCQDSPDKPGTCPPLPPGTVGICVELCSGDSSCPGTEKCCSNGCGHVCKAALPDCSTIRCLPPVCEIGFGLYTPKGACCPKCRRDKPGTCPPLPTGTFGACVELCSGDFSCPGTEKCCSNGCGHACKAPLPGKPQDCPFPTGYTNVGICLVECRSDSECFGNFKCCPNACGGGECTTPTRSCIYGGKTYQSGQTFPSLDGCNKCTCTNGTITCTEIACPNKVCTYGNLAYLPGECFTATDGCNTCRCLGTGVVTCTERACLPRP